MDLRIERIYSEEMKGDKSFQEKESWLSLLFGGERYTRKDMRETWESGVKHGIEIGLRRASLRGQFIELNDNTIDKKQREFLNMYYSLAEKYGCAIQYHPDFGMVVLSSDNDKNRDYGKNKG